MVREAKWSRIVAELADVVAFPQDPISPCWYSAFLRSIIRVCSQVKLVRRQEGDFCFVVVVKDIRHAAPRALNVQLIVLEQRVKIAMVDEVSNLVVAEPDAVVEVSEPKDRLVIVNRPVPLESKPLRNGAVITVTIFVIREACR